MRNGFWLAATIAVSATARVAAAPPAAPPCPLPLVAPAPFMGFGHPGSLSAAIHGDEQPRPELAVGQATSVTLAQIGDVRFEAQPGKLGGPVSYGGMIALTVTTPGTYRIALGNHVWLEVARAGTLLPVTADGHGPDCSGIAKMLDFTLAPGRYAIELSASPTPVVTVMAARVG